MASMALLMSIFMAAAVAPTFAADHVVQWKLQVNYTQWAAEYEFHVGDTLQFNYTPGSHNVYSVTGADFQSCNISAPLKGPFSAGNDTFNLAKPGKKWYICGFPGHCSGGMKLVIDVAADGPAPAPAPAQSAAGLLTPLVWMAAAVTAAFWMVVV